MTSPPTRPCPRCETPLVTSGLESDVLLRCSVCGEQFRLGGKASQPEVSMGLQAPLSLVFGLVSMACGVVTALPAIVLGLLALRNIRRGRSSARGKPLAIAGVATGSVMLLCCGGLFTAVAVTIPTLESTQDPERAAALAAELGSLDVPEGVWAWRAEKLPFGIRVIKYTSSDKFSQATIRMDLMHYPGWMIQTREAMWQQKGTLMQQFRGEALEAEEQLDGTLLRQVKVDADGQRYRNYFDVLETPNGFMMCIVSIKEPHPTNEPPEAKKIEFTEEQVQAFFRSYRPPRN